MKDPSMNRKNYKFYLLDNKKIFHVSKLISLKFLSILNKSFRISFVDCVIGNIPRVFI